MEKYIPRSSDIPLPSPALSKLVNGQITKQHAQEKIVKLNNSNISMATETTVDAWKDHKFVCQVLKIVSWGHMVTLEQIKE